jgi:hypothetical protein
MTLQQAIDNLVEKTCIETNAKHQWRMNGSRHQNGERVFILRCRCCELGIYWNQAKQRPIA